MTKKISHEELLRKIFSTAYCFKELGYYGSKKKAIKTLLKQKEFAKYSSQTAVRQFEQAVKIITDTSDFIRAEIEAKTPLVSRTRAEVNLAMNNLRETLSRKNSQAPQEMIQYALNWVYMNYYLR